MIDPSNFEKLKHRTDNICSLWQDVRFFAPEKASLKLRIAMLKWQSELTNALEIWINKGLDMTDGELILARVNLGTVVESWLKFFYCVYYEDYSKKPVMKKNQSINPEELTFEDLKNFSVGILWDNRDSNDYKWVTEVQHKRNAIHSFTYKDIGSAEDFLDDIEYLCQFVDRLEDRLPPVEDYQSEYMYEYYE